MRAAQRVELLRALDSVLSNEREIKAQADLAGVTTKDRVGKLVTANVKIVESLKEYLRFVK